MLSNELVHRTVKCGQALFGLSDDNDLVNVTVVEMTAGEIAHTVEELNLGQIN